MRANLVAAVACCLAAAGCEPGPTAGPTITTPARAEDSQGSFRLAFEMPKANWQTTEAITGHAWLTNIGPEAVDYGTPGGGPIFFSFDQLDGPRHVDGRGPPNCTFPRLEAGQQVSSPIRKSGPGFDPSAQPSDFDRWFSTDALVHLPPGLWKITAMAQVWHAICPVAADRPLLAAIAIRVTA